MAHGTFIFPHEPTYGWYLSVTAIGLNISWVLHNIISWMKIRPFLSRKVSIFYIVTMVLCWPYWVLEIYANFTYFNNINDIFLKTRPLEPLFRYDSLYPMFYFHDPLSNDFHCLAVGVIMALSPSLILQRDPWWVLTGLCLFWTIKREYNFKLWELIVVSPRFGVMLASMLLSIAFIVVDTCSVLNAFSGSDLPTGVEPFWKVSIPAPRVTRN